MSTPTHHRFLAERIRFQTALGDKIRSLREASGMSRGDVAKAIGASRSTIASYEEGTTPPTAFGVWQLAMLFDCSTDELMVDPPSVGEAAE